MLFVQVARHYCSTRNRTLWGGSWLFSQMAKIMPVVPRWAVPSMLPRRAELPSTHGLASEAGDKNLHKLAEQTGGRMFYPGSPKEVAKAFAKISEELRSRYEISYKPADFQPDGHFRKIKIDLRKTGKKADVRARKGYYARAVSVLSADPPQEALSFNPPTH